MSSSGSAITAQVIATYQELTTVITLNIVVTALLLYDVILTSGREYQYIWRSPKSWVSRVLYMWNRYMFLFNLLVNLGTIPAISVTSCNTLMWLAEALLILNLIGPAMFTTMRIYALSRKNRVLGGVALVLSMAPFIINAITAYQKPPVYLPAPLNCAQTDTASRNLSIGLTVASRGSLILVDSLAAAVTWRQTRVALQLRTGTVKRPSLEQVMWENGAVYFCVLASTNIVDLVLVLVSIALPPLNEQSSYVLYFVDPISSILNSRFLLALHETNARLEGAGDASISSLSLNTGSGDNRRGDSPDLPEFLGVIGGSIHSFHDENEDLRSLEFAPPQEEDQSESEGAIQEIRREGVDVA